MLVKTKKLLVGYDITQPDSVCTHFLIVEKTNHEYGLVDLHGEERYTMGLLVYVGKEVMASDIFSQITETERKIENAEEFMKILEQYIQQLQAFHIGNILKLESNQDYGFRLVKYADKPPKCATKFLP